MWSRILVLILLLVEVFYNEFKMNCTFLLLVET